MIKPDKRTKQWIGGGVIILLSIMIWIVYFYSPLKEEQNKIALDYTLYNDQIQMLNQRLQNLYKAEKNSMSKGNDLTRFSKIMIYGESIDDINAETQLLFQNFFEKNDIPLISYKVISSSKWKNHDIGRVEFNIMASITGLDQMLEYIENIDKVIRIESLNINYTGKKVNSLRVNLRMETLFLDIGTRQRS